jgi:hypothetical protein
MVSRVLIMTAAVVALAACQRPYDPYTGRANTGYANPSYGDSSGYGYGYGNSAPAREVGDGCAGGQQADPLHQNRPGGSDYSAWRCHTKGY